MNIKNQIKTNTVQQKYKYHPNFLKKARLLDLQDVVMGLKELKDKVLSNQKIKKRYLKGI